jgi:2Fe-2S ferredoxin
MSKQKIRLISKGRPNKWLESKTALQYLLLRNKAKELKMIKVTYIESDGTSRDVNVEEGVNLMDAALDNMVPGIDGDCGGVCACATCHVHVEPSWIDKLKPMDETEDAMLELTDDRNESSRLGCQIIATPELDGLIVYTPEGQH